MKAERFLGDPMKDDLLNAIKTGELKPGERLPPFRSLASQYKVSINTVQRVMRELVAAQVLETTHGRGTFVASAKDLGVVTDFAVGVYARTTGDFYGDIFECLRDSLSRYGAVPIVCDMAPERLQYVKQMRFRDLVSGHPTAFCADGALSTNPRTKDLFLYKELKRLQDRIHDLIFLNRYENPDRLEASYFLFDYEDAGYQIARYLYGLGHRRIAYHTFGAPIAKGAYEDDIYRGARRVVSELGGTFDIVLIAPQKDEDAEGTQRMFEVFKRPDRPTAVMVAADFLAEYWMIHLPKLNLRVPQDVSMVGFFNTPWTTKLPVALTSVQMNIEKLVLSVVNHIVASKSSESPVREDVTIGASMVLRQSCAPAPVEVR